MYWKCVYITRQNLKLYLFFILSSYLVFISNVTVRNVIYLFVLFLQGEEIYNTYGQLANWQLLQMYGFAECYPNNHFDTVRN